MSLEIRNLSNPISLKGNEFQHFTSLQRLYFWHCEWLKFIPEDGFNSLTIWNTYLSLIVQGLSPYQSRDSNSHQYKGLFKAWVPTRTGASFVSFFWVSGSVSTRSRVPEPERETLVQDCSCPCHAHKWRRDNESWEQKNKHQNPTQVKITQLPLPFLFN